METPFADCSDEKLLVLLCKVLKELRERGVDVPSHMELLPRIMLAGDISRGYVDADQVFATALSEGRLSVLFTTSSSDPPSTSPIYPCKRKNASSGQHTNTAPDVMPPKRASEEDIAVAAPQDSEHDGFGPPFTPSLKEPCFTKQRDAKPAALPPSAKGSAARHAIISATLQVPPSPSAKGSKARLDAISEALATLCLQDS